MEGRAPPHPLGAPDQRDETRKGYPRVLHRRAYHRDGVIRKDRIGVKHAYEGRAGLDHSTINRRGPPANGMLDQAPEPALARKCGRVVLTSAIDRDDFSRRRIEDSEQAKESRHDRCLIQDRDYDCNSINGAVRLL
jgi:hypothetical protein